MAGRPDLDCDIVTVRALILAAIAAAVTFAPQSVGEPTVAPPPFTIAGTLTDQEAKASVNTASSSSEPGREGPARAVSMGAASDAEWMSTLGCGDTSNPDRNSSAEACLAGSEACVAASGRPGIMYYAWFRPIGSTGSWTFAGQTCDPESLPAPAPPPIPTMAEVQQAFMALPFGKPTVAIQPVGGTTLVNLPTFYQIRWDGTGLVPGQVSSPVQLLSWSVEFEIAQATYDIDFGDGTRSGPTSDTGGPYPSGTLRHTYTQAVPAADVKADVTLAGRFRVNGGAWISLADVADLQDEPVTVLRVAEARARLYNE